MLKTSLVKVFLAFIFLTAGNTICYSQTTIWIVRHAEKETSNPKNNNPGLSDIGNKRAKDLISFLSKDKPDIIFSSNYKRTNQTVKGFNKLIISYNPNNLKALASLVKEKYLGKKILIVGHSNTVLETIEAFGIKKPLQALSDDDYDYIFKLILSGKADKVEVYHFGQPHRAK